MTIPTDGRIDLDALAPCPFCGGEASIVRQDVEPQGDPWYGKKLETFVRCTRCGTCLFDTYFHEGFADKTSAIAAWNRRAAIPSEQGEAVAWVFELARARQQQTGEWMHFGPPQLSFTKPNVPDGSIRNLHALGYAHHAPAAGVTRWFFEGPLDGESGLALTRAVADDLARRGAKIFALVPLDQGETK